MSRFLFRWQTTVAAVLGGCLGSGLAIHGGAPWWQTLAGPVVVFVVIALFETYHLWPARERDRVRLARARAWLAAYKDADGFITAEQWNARPDLFR